MGRRKRNSQQKTNDVPKAKKQRIDNNSDRQQKQSQKGKKGKKQKKGQGKSNDLTWVETCKEVVPKGDKVYEALTVVLTRVELKDDHTHSSASTPSDTAPSDNGSKEKSSVDIGSEGTSIEKDDDGGKTEAEFLSPCKSTQEKAMDDPEEKEEKNAEKNFSVNTTSGGISVDGNGDLKGTENPKETTHNSEDSKERNNEETNPPANAQPENTNFLVADTQLSPKVENNSKKDESKNVDENSPQPTKNENKGSESHFIRVKRAPSAIGKLKFPFKFQKGFKPLPNGDCGDGIVNPHPKDEVPDKYWAQRKRLFSRFDDGIQLDKEGWYSVTPEAIANHVAKRIAKITKPEEESEPNPFARSSHERGSVILDAFCGCGGNAISFAKAEAVSTVVCIDNDRSKLKMAAKNASVYGISPEKLILIESDACFVIDKCYNNGRLITNNTLPPQTAQSKVIDELFGGYRIGGIGLLPEHIDAIFLSPPWGGMDYQKVGKRGYDISTCMKINAVVDNTKENQSTNDTSVQACEDDTPDKAENGNKQETTQINGEQLLALAAKGTKDRRVIFFLPRNTDGVSLGRSALKAGYKGSIELEQNMLNGKLKTLTAYFGKKSRKSDSSMFRPPKHSK